MTEITLPRDVEDLVEAEVAAGYAPDAQTLVASAVRGHLEQLAILRQSLDEAKADFLENGGIAVSEVRAELMARLKRNAG